MKVAGSPSYDKYLADIYWKGMDTELASWQG